MTATGGGSYVGQRWYFIYKSSDSTSTYTVTVTSEWLYKYIKHDCQSGYHSTHSNNQQ
ncbi:MAG: hypothetical protein IPO37_01625 [Saprospiraceae bacterium]|nr:hypothetical protein [Saprospiraceae bacterium]